MHQIFGGGRVANQARCKCAHRRVVTIVELAERLEVPEPEPLDRSSLGMELGPLSGGEGIERAITERASWPGMTRSVQHGSVPGPRTTVQTNVDTSSSASGGQLEPDPECRPDLGIAVEIVPKSNRGPPPAKHRKHR